MTAIYIKPGAYEARLFVRGHGGKGIGRVPISVYELTSAFIPTPKRFALAPGDRQIVEVAFSPPDTETHSTAFVLTDHASGTKRTFVSAVLTGRG